MVTTNEERKEAISFSVSTPDGEKLFEVEYGTTIYFVGANGSGKTRLASSLEKTLGLKAHRISAQRALSVLSKIEKITENEAREGLTYGYISSSMIRSDLNFRDSHRWKGNIATSMLDDYKFLLQLLFAEKNKKAIELHNDGMKRGNKDAAKSNLDIIVEVWQTLLPHLSLEYDGDELICKNEKSQSSYLASEMSDGERSILYLLGQALTAASGSMLIFDEPELHIHRTIMPRLWDIVESLRKDCAMLVISHDIEFVSNRAGARYIIKEYIPPNWVIEDVPEVIGFSEDSITLISGSRAPILFVEGQASSLDNAIFRACYPDWTIVPRGSCQQVIQSVIGLRENPKFTRVRCVGMIDGDDYSETEISYFSSKGIKTLTVSEIENLFLLPDVLRELIVMEGYDGENVGIELDKAITKIFAKASNEVTKEEYIMRHTRRYIDRSLKKIDLSAYNNIDILSQEYENTMRSLNISGTYERIKDVVNQSIKNKDILELLKWYNDKSIMEIPSSVGGRHPGIFKQYITRIIISNKYPKLIEAFQRNLPDISSL